VKTVAMFLMLAVVPGFGQQGPVWVPTGNGGGYVANPMGGLVDAYRDAIRIKMERQRLETEAAESRSLQNLLNAQAAAIRAETERLKAQNRPTLPDPPAPVSDTAFNRAAHAVELRYSDFLEYRDEAARLIPEFDTSKGLESVNLEHSIESLYLIAKYASFSNKATLPAPKAVDVLTGDPEFHRLPMATRIRFLKAVAPELSKFPDDDWVVVLNGMAARVEKPAK
jgi:hypothetical protein